MNVAGSPSAPVPAENAPYVARAHRTWERIAFVLFWAIHLGCFAAIWTGVTVKSLFIAAALYWVRMFIVTAGYHRYFSHRTFKTSRWFQFLLGLGATTTIQKGPLWWAANHRHHHKYSDMPEDVHSVRQRGFWWSHVGWILSTEHVDTDMHVVKDLAKFPELVALNRYHWVAPLLVAIGCYALDGWAGVVVGFGWSQVALWHGTFTINSLSHVFGNRRFATTDDSRNNWLLAIVTMGEGWHNNHHHYMHSANQGFYWWEWDPTYYILKGLEKVGIVWDVKRNPERVYAEAMKDAPILDVAAVKGKARAKAAEVKAALEDAVSPTVEPA